MPRKKRRVLRKKAAKILRTSIPINRTKKTTFVDKMTTAERNRWEKQKSLFYP